MGLGELGILGLLVVLILGGKKVVDIFGEGKKKLSTTSTPRIESYSKAEFQKQNIKTVESPKNPEPPKA